MARIEVTMPQMGESITEGTIISWHKQVGDWIEVDETLLEIGTDKVDTEVPSPAAGTVREILAQEGDTVEVGKVVAILETEVEQEQAEQSPAPVAPKQAAVAPEAVQDHPPGPAQALDPEPGDEAHLSPAASTTDVVDVSTGTNVDVVMPKMGESIVEGTIISWHKKVGDRIEADETLLEIGTDKVDTEVPSPVAGIVREILVPEGETIEVGARIAVIATGADESGEAPLSPAPATRTTPEPAPVPDRTPSVDVSTGDGTTLEVVHDDDQPLQRIGTSGRFFSPLVRSIAEKEGLSMQELESIEGSGREQRVTKEDLMSYLEQRKTKTPQRTAPPVRVAAAPAEPAGVTEVTASGDRVEIIEMDRMRQIIAEHMVRSKATSAHVTSFAEADVTNLVKLRERNKEPFLKREGIPLTFTPFFVQAVVEALHEHPILNASVEGKRIIIKKDLHIGIAVAIGKTGLVAPVIRKAGERNLVGLVRASHDLAERARSKQLQPDELQGGTFTITNIGSLGSIMGTPIINQPQVAILATGAIKKRPVVFEDPNLGDVIVIRHMMYVSMSYDHRIVDGAMGASFLKKFVSVVESFDPHADL